MSIIGRYIFRQTALALVMILITLTLIIWMTIALRQLSLMTSQGQSFIIFMKMTMLAMPNMIAIVAPVALLISALHTLNRLSGDSELIILSASGANAWRVARPYLALAAVVAAFVMASNAYIAPHAMRLLREYKTQVSTDLIGQFLQPGKFTTSDDGLTVHIAGRTNSGDLLGLMVHDARDKNQIMTYLAEHARFEKDGNNNSQLVTHNGEIHFTNSDNTNFRSTVFTSGTFDLTEFRPPEKTRGYKPRERLISELLYPDPNDKYYKQYKGKFRKELHDRLSNPLYSFLFMLIVIVHLGYPRTTRDNRMLSVAAAFGACAALRVIGLTGVNMMAKSPMAAFIVWGIPIGGIIIAGLMVHYQIRPLSLPSLSWLSLKRSKAA
ncbi:MAG: LPS export ABC transporter permease LptF [Alphaproteobacteria bacterium]